VIKRKRYLFTGIVQGVGFRPFIHRVATEHFLSGFVQNRSDGVVVEIEGPAESLEKFTQRVTSELPPLAELFNFSGEDIDILHEKTFRIVESEKGERGEVHIAPDIAVCDECLQELFDPRDIRYAYPFINCTNCGPRLTIIMGVPYDRENTSMACFPLCSECRKEYNDPSDRRFHAEPNACPVCGPSLSLLDNEGKALACPDPVKKAKELLLQGFVLAVKGLGGFHLSVDATNDRAVSTLRTRKFRETKPLAIMVKNVHDASKIAKIKEEEKAVLLSPQRPIVLVKKKNQEIISSLIAPGMSNWGVMLPYMPLHHLLLQAGFFALVMTSANQTDEPICISNREAVSRLKGIADFFLIHNRDILIRCDDSIVMVAAGKASLTRRSRGFVPKPVALRKKYHNVLALGPQMKTTVCILKGNFAFVSPHIGDLETPQARDYFHESIAVMQKITECKPQLIACDLHPGYYSSLVSRSMSTVEVFPVQHHHAHIVSCMAENQISGKVIGLAMDGTGYGLDAQVWGGEFLVADEADFIRAGHLKYYLLPGGEKAIREPWRIALSLLREAYGNDWKEVAEKFGFVPQKDYYDLIDRIMEQGINTPSTSSLGRLFDGVAAITGVRRQVSFEGQAAMELEGIAEGTSDHILPFEIYEEADTFFLDLIPAIHQIVESLLRKTPREMLVTSFHRTLPVAFARMAENIRQKAGGLNRVVLSGGCFQNRILLEGCINELQKFGFEVFSHRLVPTNDGGISIGQAVCAGARARKRAGLNNI
jgi:hydrogenase maturation protein HypF